MKSSHVRFMSQNFTHFGFEQVPENEKANRVHDVFTNVAKSYDNMNDAMSFGIHRLWKDIFMRNLNPGPNVSLLDVAGGTGDIAFRFLKYKSSLEDGNSRKVTVCDINQDMLDVGQKRASEYGFDKHNISWVCGNAEELPFEDETFSAFTIAFGIRNCTHIDKVLKEAYRVLKPGGRFLCLEFSRVNHPLLRRWIFIFIIKKNGSQQRNVLIFQESTMPTLFKSSQLWGKSLLEIGIHINIW